MFPSEYKTQCEVQNTTWSTRIQREVQNTTWSTKTQREVPNTTWSTKTQCEVQNTTWSTKTQCEAPKHNVKYKHSITTIKKWLRTILAIVVSTTSTSAKETTSYVMIRWLPYNTYYSCDLIFARPSAGIYWWDFIFRVSTYFVLQYFY